MNVITKTVSLPDGRTISIETGKVAKQTDGSVVLRMGNTVLLATVCAAKDAVPGTDFMPLQVDYKEQYSAAGRFPGGFTKREGKSGDNEILTSRLVDRVLRPLFPSNYHAEVYVQIMLLSADGVDQPDALAGFAASAAMACSDIPFECPISEVRVARINGEYVINPTFEQMKDADMDIMVGASAENIMMVEGEMKEVSEQDMIGALKAAMAAIKPMCELQTELSKELGTDVKREYCHEVNDEELRQTIVRELYDKAYDIATSGTARRPTTSATLSQSRATTTRSRARRLSTRFSLTSRRLTTQLTQTSQQRSSTRSTQRWCATTPTLCATLCAAASSTRASVSTVVAPTRYVLFGSRRTAYQVLTGRLSLHVVRHSLSLR